MVFPTQYTESVRMGSKQVFTKPTKTEPDNSMSIPEIIAKFTRGLGLQVQQHPWQSGSAPEPDGYQPNDAELEQVLELQSTPQVQTPPSEPTPEPASPAPDPAPVDPAPADPAPAK